MTALDNEVKSCSIIALSWNASKYTTREVLFTPVAMCSNWMSAQLYHGYPVPLKLQWQQMHMIFSFVVGPLFIKVGGGAIVL